MTDPLEALESLVAELDHVSTKPFRDQVSGTLVQHYVHRLEPIIQQLKEWRTVLLDERLRELDEAGQVIESLRAEVEGLESRLDDCDDQAVEMVKLREALERIAGVAPGLHSGYLDEIRDIAARALQASSPKEMGEIPEHMYPPGHYPFVAKDSDTPEKCPTCGGKNPAKPYGPKAGTWSGNPCPDPFHTQPSDTEEPTGTTSSAD